MIHFTVPGPVRGKGRPRIGRIGNHARMYADAKTVSYENLVALACRQAMGSAPPITGPVHVQLVAHFTPPASASKKVRAAMLFGETGMTKKPDLDNIVKVLDALNGIAWIDDCQVVMITALKNYAETPGLEIVIREAT